MKEPRTRRASFVLSAVLLTLSCCVVGALAVVIVYTLVQVNATGRAYKGTRPMFDQQFQPDPVLGWRLIPNLRVHSRVPGHEDALLLSTDRYGFRNAGTELPARGAAMVLGDSFVQGYWLADDETVTARLAAKVDGFVYNFGVGGYSTDQEVLVGRQALQAFKVNWVVLLLVTNDLPFLDRPTAYGKAKPFFEADARGRLRFERPTRPELPEGTRALPALDFAARGPTEEVSLRFDSPGYLEDRRSLFWLKLRDNLDVIAGALRAPGEALATVLAGRVGVPRAGWQLLYDFPRNNVGEIYTDPNILAHDWDLAFQLLSHLRDRAAEKGARLLVVFVPEMSQVFYPELGYNQPQKDFTRLCRERGLSCVEPLGRFIEEEKTRDVFIRDDGHLSPYGAELTAELIAKAIAR